MSEARKNRGTGMRASVEGSSEQPSERGQSDLATTDSSGDGLNRRLSQGIPSAPLFKVLPLARIIPQDVHSVMDYMDAAAVASGALMTKCPKATAASWALGGSGIAASALTDYRLSLKRVIPIEAHEVIDYAFAAAAITAPFIFGYYKTAPRVAAMHIVAGVGTALASLFTDYRAYRGVGKRTSRPIAS
jgi:hypothetical protein